MHSFLQPTSGTWRLTSSATPLATSRRCLWSCSRLVHSLFFSSGVWDGFCLAHLAVDLNVQGSGQLPLVCAGRCIWPNVLSLWHTVLSCPGASSAVTFFLSPHSLLPLLSGPPSCRGFCSCTCRISGPQHSLGCCVESPTSELYCLLTAHPKYITKRLLGGYKLASVAEFNLPSWIFFPHAMCFKKQSKTSLS